MADLITLTIDGKTVRVPAGTLVVEAAKTAGIEIPTFCYYKGLSLQAACRMCLVEVEKMPKLVPSCTLPAAAGMVVRTDTPTVVDARRAMLEFLLTNHPLDCPVCDKGGECELQDTTFRYGAGESRFVEIKQHVPEQQWSPLVYYDNARCILCYRCVRICDEGMGVAALGLGGRGVASAILPNQGDHLECDECGNCIDICPVGALTSSTYRYQTRPWEMTYAPTICTHCGDGCKTTLGVRDGEILRANNRDLSGINGEFLCVKGRFGHDFVASDERLKTPLIRRDGELKPASWKEALTVVAAKFREFRERGGVCGVIGSTRTTNEENHALQRFAREWLGTTNIDHHRSGDVPALLKALGGRADALATMADLYNAPAVVVLGADLAEQHPLIAFQLRANWRHHRAAVYTVTRGPVRERDYATQSIVAEAGREVAALDGLREALSKHAEIVFVFGASVQGAAVAELVKFGDSLGVRAKYVALVDYSNSRGALDMGVTPEFKPGYEAVEQPGLNVDEMLAAEDLELLWVVGANPLEHAKLASERAFIVVQELFLTETARAADVVLPAASAYEKDGTVTNTCGETQRLKRGARVEGTKTDLEIIALIDRMAGAKPASAPAQSAGSGQAALRPSEDTMFTSGTLGRYSKRLAELREAPGALYGGEAK
jgi:NADH-quinone oxidoreductase subunit G